MKIRHEKINVKNILVLSFVFIFIFECYSWIDIITYKFPNKKFRSVKLKYILIWATNPNIEPFVSMGKGQDTFIKSHCPVNNCYITANRTFLNKITDFDAIIFHGSELSKNRKYILPESRLPYQKYIFISLESSHYYPINHDRYENFFNWTWTYKLNSDLVYEYFKIRKKQGDVIGPNQTISWLKVKEMEPIDDSLKDELSQKNLFAAWFVSNCHAKSKRELYVKDMQNELKNYKTSMMSVDVFGRCGQKKCLSSNHSHCQNLVKKSYHFYLSFENWFAEDYVTEKLLTALQNNAVPVVFGGSNYSRFLPDGAYLDARKLSPAKLVRQMIDIMIMIKRSTTVSLDGRNTIHSTIHKKAQRLITIVDFVVRLTQRLICLTLVHTEFRKWWNV